MRKFFVLSLLLFLLPIAVFSQEVFKTIPFNDALKLSSETQQLIFLQFESEKCRQCNEVANKAFENKDLADLLEQAFICVKIEASHPDRKEIGALYNVSDGFGSFIIDKNKTLIHSFHKTTTKPSYYKEQVDIALTKAGEDIRITELEKEYKNGNKSIGIMESLLLKRKSLNLETDSLLDEYTGIVPADSLQSQATLSFIAQMAPIAGSHADLVLRKNFQAFTTAWQSIPLSSRIAINNRIIYKSRQKAIKDKDEKFAYRVANFARSTYSDRNSRAASASFEYNMMTFYKETNDTINYLARAIYYYDDYYMTVSVDSVSKKDSADLRKLFEKQKPTAIQNGDATRMVKTVSFKSSVQGFTRSLNEGAWNFYQMTTDPLHLARALQWAKRANEFSESPEAMDVYARLLYKTGKKIDAIEWESKAIDVSKKRGFKPTDFERLLSNMKEGKSVIDN
jgi:hypothetical protein